MMDTPANLLARAQAGDSNAAADLWRAIDAGQVDDTITAAWARNVALQVVAKVLNTDIPANRRAENARAALGLEGRLDANPELKALTLCSPDMTPAQLADIADLLVDVKGKDRRQVRRQIEHIARTYRRAEK